MLFTGQDNIEEEEDPRYELVKRLLEYKRFKDASSDFSTLEDEQRKVFYRHDFEGDDRTDDSIDDPGLQNLTLFNLIKAYKYAMEHQPKEIVHNIIRFNVTLDEQIEYISKICDSNEYVSFKFLIGSMHEKLRIVVTFIAILELAKNGSIGIKINNDLTDFEIFKLADVNKEVQYDEY